MVVEGGFRVVIQFFDKLGMYDVILPFFLIFTIVFALLEKSKIFGTEEFDGQEYTKKNINAMIAFVIGFIFVASTRAVAIINEALANVALMLVVGLSFLMMVGMFFSNKEDMFAFFGKGRWFFIVIMFLATILIFLWAIKTKDGTPWLKVLSDLVVNQFNSAAVASVFMGLIIVVIIWLIVRDPKVAKKKEEE